MPERETERADADGQRAAAACGQQPDTPDDGQQPGAADGGQSRARARVKLVGTFLSTFLVTLLVCVAAGAVAARATGCELLSVQSGSMEPAYPVHSLVVVVPTSYENIEVGDVVTYVFNEEGTLVTHRVVAKDAAAGTLTTKGDANEAADATPVLAGNVVGKVVFCIPGIGGILTVLNAGHNRAVAIAIVLALLAFSLAWAPLRRAWKRRRKGKEGAHAAGNAGHAQQALG